MSIIVNVDVMLAKRKMSSAALAEKIGITPANLSILKTEGQGRQILHAGVHLQGSGLPAGGCP